MLEEGKVEGDLLAVVVLCASTAAKSVRIARKETVRCTLIWSSSSGGMVRTCEREDQLSSHCLLNLVS